MFSQWTSGKACPQDRCLDHLIILIDNVYDLMHMNRYLAYINLNESKHSNEFANRYAFFESISFVKSYKYCGNGALSFHECFYDITKLNKK